LSIILKLWGKETTTKSKKFADFGRKVHISLMLLVTLGLCCKPSNFEKEAYRVTATKNIVKLVARERAPEVLHQQ
jgi:hypothetical protein